MNDIDATLKGLKDHGQLPGVVRWWIEPGRDATNDPAVWVWVVLKDEQFDRATLVHVRDVIRGALRESDRDDEGEWTYVRLIPVSEAGEP